MIRRRYKRNYAKESLYENSPAQVRRREARNKARRAALRKGLVHKGDNKEVGHIGDHRTGSLKGVPTRIVSRSINRRVQPDRPGGKSARYNYSKRKYTSGYKPK